MGTTIGAGDFKAKCLQLPAAVAVQRESPPADSAVAGFGPFERAAVALGSSASGRPTPVDRRAKTLNRSINR